MPRKKPAALAVKPSAIRKDNSVWRHNQFFGYARMMEEQCKHILHSETATALAKSHAATIMHESKALGAALKERVKP